MNLIYILKTIGQCLVVAAESVHSAPALAKILHFAGVLNAPEHGLLHLCASAFALASLTYHLMHKDAHAAVPVPDVNARQDIADAMNLKSKVDNDDGPTR